MTPAQDALITALDRLRGAVEDLRDRLEHLGRPSPAASVDLLDSDQVADELGISPRTLRRERKRRAFPAPVRGRGRPRWRRKDILAYVERAR